MTKDKKWTQAARGRFVSMIDKFISENGYSPSVRDVCAMVGIPSPGSVKYRLGKLRDKGLITFVDNMPRTIRVVR